MRIFRNRDITHRDFAAVLTRYLEDDLPARERARLEAHLAHCPPCAAYIEQMRQTLAVSGRIEPEEIPAELRAELVHAFGDWRARRAGHP